MNSSSMKQKSCFGGKVWDPEEVWITMSFFFFTLYVIISQKMDAERWLEFWANICPTESQNGL